VSRAAIFLVLAIACSSKTEPPRSEPAPRVSEPALAPTPAPAPEVASDRVDRVEHSGDPADQPPGRAPVRPAQRGRSIEFVEVVLRSSPPGASAAVDGKPVGPTPTYWAGEADGRTREFTFALPGYTPARYRFVPITSGVVHARLEVLADEPEPGSMIRAPGNAAPSRPPAPDAGPGPAPSAPASGAGPEP
jgi:hypothetical protein